MVAQLAIQGMQAFQEETCPVAAQTPAAELFALQPLAVEDIQRQQAISLQGSLQGRMVIQAQVRCMTGSSYAAGERYDYDFTLGLWCPACTAVGRMS